MSMDLREEAYRRACDLIRASGSSPYRHYEYTLRLALWLADGRGEEAAPEPLVVCTMDTRPRTAHLGQVVQVTDNPHRWWCYVGDPAGWVKVWPCAVPGTLTQGPHTTWVFSDPEPERPPRHAFLAPLPWSGQNRNFCTSCGGHRLDGSLHF